MSLPVKTSLLERFRALARSEFVKEFVLYAASFVGYQGSRFLVFLAAARILEPATFGIWNLLNLILVYSGLSHLGVLNGMNRDVPFYRGRGDDGRVDAVRRTSLGFVYASSILAGLVIFAGSRLADPAYQVPLQWMAALFVVTQIYTYLQTYLRSYRHFFWLSMQQFAFAALFPLLVIPITLLSGLSGFILGQTIAILGTSLVLFYVIPFDFKPRLDFKEVGRLIRLGFPIMAVGLLYGLLTTTDRWLIAAMLGVEQLGYYTLAIMVTGLLTLIPTAISQQIYPRMAESYGKTMSYGGLKEWMIRQSMLSLIVILPLAALVFFALPPVVERFLPEYASGITAMKVILIGVFVLPFYKGFGAFLNTVGKQVHYMITQGIAVLVNTALIYLLISLGMGIEGAALGTSITYILYTAALGMVSLNLISKGENLHETLPDRPDEQPPNLSA